MKKIKLIIIFTLGILVGFFSWQLKTQINASTRPIIREGKLDVEQLINSISDTLDTKNLNLIDTKYERFETVYDILQDNYYDTEKLDDVSMIEKAVKAFVDAIDDPYTVYMDSAQNSGFMGELKWETDIEGIWAVVTKKDYYIMIEEVIKGSPAYQAGLMALDRIIMVGSDSVKDLSVDEAVSMIRWPKWSTVILTIERISKDEEKEILEKKVIRDKLSIPSVNSEVFDEKIGYINISIIGEETEHLFQQTIKEFKEQDVEGIILDLRWNGWGLLPIAVEIASHFVPEDEIIVTAKYKTYEDEVYKSKGYKDLQGMPIVILIDGLTASAGEIIALALQEQIRAIIVGTQSFGKGSIQTMDEFKDNASLKYTIGKRYSPNDENVDKIWIKPDISIEFDVELYTENRTDNQLEKAKETVNAMMKQTR